MNRLAFLQAIRDDPSDDLPRLAYADWLEEQGDSPRGEMIRLQIELTRGPPDRARALALLRRLRELVVAHRGRWLGALGEVAPDAIFERGFVEELRVPVRALVRAGVAALEDHPVTRAVLSEARGQLGALAGCPGLAGLSALSLRGEALSSSDVAALARSPHLGRLRSLDLRDARVTAAGLEALLASPTLPRLEVLNLAYNRIGDDLGPLLSLPGLPALRHLDLSGNGVSGRSVAGLAGPSWLSRLAALSLANNQLGEVDIEKLAESTHLATVASLNLSHYRLPERAARRLRERHGPRVVV